MDGTLNALENLAQVNRAESQTNEFTKCMKNLRIKGNWNIVKGRYAQMVARLTANDDLCAAGEDVELLGRIQKQTHKIQRDIKRAIRDRLRTNHLN